MEEIKGVQYEDVVIDTTNELHTTIYGMISDKHRDRFKAEYRQLIIRIDRLTDRLSTYKRQYKAIELDLLERQLKAMYDYKNILELRASLEGINLKES